MDEAHDLEALADRIERLSSAATNTPWFVSPAGGSIRTKRTHIGENGAAVEVVSRICATHDGNARSQEADYALIVELVNAKDEIIASLRALSQGVNDD